ncbi:hypothetical protein Q8W71_03220 [Methylobacterium sp. NEAU 140]|uniref:hypothetical protein n=1 Tax=Methylobacterium sp. NEAU 140 TaxID=3064945 RepID=UPI0027360A7C|nr:hypothetical protein [Methylobacterium sp. NEAU 140]MDP4021623.1 hypothetical protein [Methylobacterium sp. NEAU 140]
MARWALITSGAARPSADAGQPAPDLTLSASVAEKGHGRIETRRLSVSHDCVAPLG